jgi:hypothetical protein
VPGQPAVQPYSGHVALGFNGLVCAVRPAVEFCEWAAPLVPTIMAYHRGSVNRPRV